MSRGATKGRSGQRLAEVGLLLYTARARRSEHQRSSVTWSTVSGSEFCWIPCRLCPVWRLLLHVGRSVAAYVDQWKAPKEGRGKKKKKHGSSRAQEL